MILRMRGRGPGVLPPVSTHSPQAEGGRRAGPGPRPWDGEVSIDPSWRRWGWGAPRRGETSHGPPGCCAHAPMVCSCGAECVCVGPGGGLNAPRWGLSQAVTPAPSPSLRNPSPAQLSAEATQTAHPQPGHVSWPPGPTPPVPHPGPRPASTTGLSATHTHVHTRQEGTQWVHAPPPKPDPRAHVGPSTPRRGPRATRPRPKNQVRARWQAGPPSPARVPQSMFTVPAIVLTTALARGQGMFSENCAPEKRPLRRSALLPAVRT